MLFHLFFFLTSMAALNCNPQENSNRIWCSIVSRLKVLVAQSCPTLWDHVDLTPVRLLCPWDFTGKNKEVSCNFLLQGIFLTQESNPFVLRCRRILYPLNMYPIRVDKAGPFVLSSRPCTLERGRLEIYIRSRTCFPNIYSVFENRFHPPSPTPSIIFHQLHTLTDLRMRLMFV